MNRYTAQHYWLCNQMSRPARNVHAIIMHVEFR